MEVLLLMEAAKIKTVLLLMSLWKLKMELLMLLWKNNSKTRLKFLLKDSDFPYLLEKISSLIEIKVN